MSLEPTNKGTVDQWLERVSKDRYAEAERLYDQADTYWSGIADEIKLRVYQQLDFGGYHTKWLDELWTRHRHFPASDQYDDPIDWFTTWMIGPEQDGLYLDGFSYLVDLENGNCRDDDVQKDGDSISDAFVERGCYPTADEDAKQVVSSYFPVLVKVLR